MIPIRIGDITESSTLWSCMVKKEEILYLKDFRLCFLHGCNINTYAAATDIANASI